MKTALDITTAIGFYETYFNLLPYFKTQYEVFEYLNDEVEFITGKQPYKHFNEFINKPG
ncbi:MAG: hypothetical protein KDC67_06625 [Ignavibacteriae bacterium]|nr:hypothetical protein [Ignavibacteriota bacterium]